MQTQYKCVMEWLNGSSEPDTYYLSKIGDGKAEVLFRALKKIDRPGDFEVVSQENEPIVADWLADRGIPLIECPFLASIYRIDLSDPYHAFEFKLLYR